MKKGGQKKGAKKKDKGIKKWKGEKKGNRKVKNEGKGKNKLYWKKNKHNITYYCNNSILSLWKEIQIIFLFINFWIVILFLSPVA